MARQLILWLLVFSIYQTQAQTSRNWTSFCQTVEITTQKERAFVFKGYIKVITDDTTAGAGLWARVDTHNDERGFFDNMGDRRVRDTVWKEYTIQGTINENSKTIVIGGISEFDGDFYFDKLSLAIENDKGEMEPVSIGNASFETEVVQEEIDTWNEGTRKTSKTSIKEFAITTSNDAIDGRYSLLIKGRETKPNFDFYNIKEQKGFTPQVGTLLSMLDNLKERATIQTQNLSVYQIDHLHDEQANRIGALIMHLAATEAYYQVLTFENRVFNEEEKKKWGVALGLGEDARTLYKDKPISYYLEEFDKVRARTKELLATVDDDWLQKDILGEGVNNYYAWFHVMEHQSSHLGQILFLKKRIPPEPKIINEEEIRN